MRVVSLLAAAAVLLAAPAHGDDAATALLAEAQAAHAAAQQGLSVRVDLDHSGPNQHETASFTVSLRGEDVRIDVLSPAEHAGEILLIAGGKAWYARPGLKRPTPVSRQQVLGGRARAGDLLLALSRMDTLYTATLVGPEKKDGNDTTRLALTSISPDAPTPAATVWLSSGDHRLLIASLQDSAGAIERIATLSWGATLAGKPFPTAMRVVEASGATTELRYSAATAGALPDALFSPAALIHAPTP